MLLGTSCRICLVTRLPNDSAETTWNLSPTNGMVLELGLFESLCGLPTFDSSNRIQSGNDAT